MGARHWTALAILATGALVANGCGTDAVDIDGCRAVEEARCQQAQACGIPLEPPYFTSGNDVDSCIRYYDDACLHGLASADPGPAALHACVSAVQNDTAKKDGCSIVKAPQSDVAACGWLTPPPSVAADASAAPPSGDGGPDAGAATAAH